MISSAPAVTSAIKILMLLKEVQPRWLGVSEIARRSALPKASAHRFITAMLAGDFVTQDPRDLTYTIGPALIELGASALADGPRLELVRTALTELAAETETSTEAFQALPDGRMICMASCAGPGPVYLNRAPGSFIPVSPLVVLMQHAWDTRYDERQLLGRLMRAERGNAALSPHAAEDLAWVRRQGYGWVIGAGDATPQNMADVARWLEIAGELGLARREPLAREHHVQEIARYTELRNLSVNSRLSSLPMLGVVGPVFDRNQQMQVQLCAVFLLAQVLPDHLPSLGQLVRRKANEVTRLLGGRSPAGEVRAEDRKI